MEGDILDNGDMCDWVEWVSSCRRRLERSCEDERVVEAGGGGGAASVS